MTSFAEVATIPHPSPIWIGRPPPYKLLIERGCLGHTMAGVRGTYDRYEFYDEKRHAFKALADLVRSIVN
jgi:hypothetical protein